MRKGRPSRARSVRLRRLLNTTSSSKSCWTLARLMPASNTESVPWNHCWCSPLVQSGIIEMSAG